MSELELAEAAEGEARRDLNDLENRIRQDVADAARVVRDRYAAERAAAVLRLNEASKAIRDIQNAAPDHPWTGKRVVKEVDRGRWGQVQIERTLGIVETRRIDSKFPANVQYGLPLLGAGFVRLLNTKGQPGLRFDDRLRDWKLVEGNIP